MVYFHCDQLSLVIFTMTLELVVILQLVCLVEFWNSAVVFKEEIGVSEDIEVDYVFDCLLDSW